MYNDFKVLMDEIQKQQVIVDDLARLVDSESIYRHSGPFQSQSWYKIDSQEENRTVLNKLEAVTNAQDILKGYLKRFQDPIKSINDGMIDLQKRSEGMASAEIILSLSTDSGI